MTSIELLHADITTVEVDAVVNAANSSLTGGGGVDGAIHAAGGPAIGEECRTIVAARGPCPTGGAVITTGGDLRASRVIHTVGPIWGTVPDEQAVRLLASCYTASLDLALRHGLRSVAFPNISTGVYRFPKELAASTAVDTVKRWVAAHHDALDRIVFVCFDDANYGIYEHRLASNGPEGAGTQSAS